MRPASSADIDLLIYADWLIDQGYEKEAEWLRESIESPEGIAWCWEYRSIGVVGGGGADIAGVIVGSGFGANVGGGGNTVGGGSVDEVGAGGSVVGGGNYSHCCSPGFEGRNE